MKFVYDMTIYKSLFTVAACCSLQRNKLSDATQPLSSQDKKKK